MTANDKIMSMDQSIDSADKTDRTTDFPVERPPRATILRRTDHVVAIDLGTSCTAYSWKSAAEPTPSVGVPDMKPNEDIIGKSPTAILMAGSVEADKVFKPSGAEAYGRIAQRKYAENNFSHGAQLFKRFKMVSERVGGGIGGGDVRLYCTKWRAESPKATRFRTRSSTRPRREHRPLLSRHVLRCSHGVVMLLLVCSMPPPQQLHSNPSQLAYDDLVNAVTKSTSKRAEMMLMDVFVATLEYIKNVRQNKRGARRRVGGFPFSPRTFPPTPRANAGWSTPRVSRPW